MPAQAVILVHGGCGPRPGTRQQLAVLRQALAAGYAVLTGGGPALDAVERAIVVLEDSGIFNAGSGARLQLDGAARLDASLMEGKTLRAGAVAGIERIRNPIHAARLVMDRTPHVLLIGEQARRFARLHHLRAGRRSPRSVARWRAQLRTADGALVELARQMQKDTVGAVALDQSGTVAAGVSTGGITLMVPGRVGDSPIVGAGMYADNRAGGIAMTGDGECIIRIGAAKEISLGLARRRPPGSAAAETLRGMRQLTQGTGGALVLGADGRFALVHTTEYLLGAYRTGHEQRVASRFRKI
jgi:beta-aspartyl-peptidase (threonine type)